MWYNFLYREDKRMPGILPVFTRTIHDEHVNSATDVMVATEISKRLLKGATCLSTQLNIVNKPAEFSEVTKSAPWMCESSSFCFFIE